MPSQGAHLAESDELARYKEMDSSILQCPKMSCCFASDMKGHWLISKEISSTITMIYFVREREISS